MIGILIFLILAILTLFIHIFGEISQVETFLFLAIFAIAAKISGFVGSILMGFAGAPGALLTWKTRCDMPPYTRAYQARRWTGLLFSAIGQCIFIILFVALTVGYVRQVISKHNTCPWILWIAGFLVAISPVKSAAEQSRWEELINPEMVRDNVLHMALGFPCIVVPVAYLIFAFFPKAMSPFSWLPFVN